MKLKKVKKSVRWPDNLEMIQENSNERRKLGKMTSYCDLTTVGISNQARASPINFKSMRRSMSLGDINQVILDQEDYLEEEEEGVTKLDFSPAVCLSSNQKTSEAMNSTFEVEKPKANYLPKVLLTSPGHLKPINFYSKQISVSNELLQSNPMAQLKSSPVKKFNLNSNEIDLSELSALNKKLLELQSDQGFARIKNMSTIGKKIKTTSSAEYIETLNIITAHKKFLENYEETLHLQ